MNKICFITGTRAEYGLLSGLMNAIQNEAEFELQIIACNMHLSPEFGLTYKQIEEDGFIINKKIENLLSSDTPCGIVKSTGLATIGFADAFVDLMPDLVILLGDRYELFAAATTALLFKIPIAHLHGGEITEGAFDDAIRHSITKMSHLHFTSTEEYRNRVIQLGEQPDRVINVGAIGIDNIMNLKLLSKTELEKELNFKFNVHNILVTFHPVTLEDNTSENQFKELLAAIDELPRTSIIFTKPNSDTNGRIIIEMIDNYVIRNKHKAISFISMGQLRYLSTLQFVDAVVGNSSSGLIEAPSFKIGTINIGDRQKGRIAAESVIYCEPKKQSIGKAFEKLYSYVFKDILKTVENPYGKGNTTKKIMEVLQTTCFNNLIKKKFYTKIEKS
jgi:GDP/UDP-N,N'-diacetylbacillosamine 2-epimerase (hydrolysing)